MSSPHPEGVGGKLAMQRALDAAGLTPSDIDYIKLHGTATPAGDAAEDKAVTGLFGTETPCSSLKNYVGHTLGASGIVESIMAIMMLREGFIPGSPCPTPHDETLQANYIATKTSPQLQTVLSNSFGFGGSNCSIVLGRPR